MSEDFQFESFKYGRCKELRVFSVYQNVCVDSTNLSFFLSRCRRSCFNWNYFFVRLRKECGNNIFKMSIKLTMKFISAWELIENRRRFPVTKQNTQYPIHTIDECACHVIKQSIDNHNSIAFPNDDCEPFRDKCGWINPHLSRNGSQANTAQSPTMNETIEQTQKKNVTQRKLQWILNRNRMFARTSCIELQLNENCFHFVLFFLALLRLHWPFKQFVI